MSSVRFRCTKMRLTNTTGRLNVENNRKNLITQNAIQWGGGGARL